MQRKLLRCGSAPEEMARALIGNSPPEQHPSNNPLPPPAAQQILAILPASQQAEIWQCFCDIAAHGCRNPFKVVELALKHMRRSLDRSAATADLRASLVLMFASHHIMLELAREAIHSARKGGRHA
jgi:hypothetical protein